ncbi:hypothetical protein PCASD_13799 [Puccinia coronata f. sp. avenae]|uniref:Uncharacterized protein n=1 Tax=Puccinia coronata f. sp. avenae TaxID=200324 RepID=A0A2N5UE56_9BASI|nr:hypothetical protein PCASD_23266 [Puccinia coronata f. sp. avenae]PLW36008.1 hypothetical protein PCASD_13799 [Puccinia coronata f. sp. avenae]
MTNHGSPACRESIASRCVLLAKRSKQGGTYSPGARGEQQAGTYLLTGTSRSSRRAGKTLSLGALGEQVYTCSPRGPGDLLEARGEQRAGTYLLAVILLASSSIVPALWELLASRTHLLDKGSRGQPPTPGFNLPDQLTLSQAVKSSDSQAITSFAGGMIPPSPVLPRCSQVPSP